MIVRIHGATKGGDLILAARAAQKMIDDDLPAGEWRLIEYEDGSLIEGVVRQTGVTVIQTRAGRS